MKMLYASLDAQHDSSEEAPAWANEPWHQTANLFHHGVAAMSENTTKTPSLDFPVCTKDTRTKVRMKMPHNDDDNDMMHVKCQNAPLSRSACHPTLHDALHVFAPQSRQLSSTHIFSQSPHKIKQKTREGEKKLTLYYANCHSERLIRSETDLEEA